MNDTSVAAAFLRGVEAGRAEGYAEGHADGYHEGYDAGHLNGSRAGWDAHEEVDRIAFANYLSEFGGQLGQPSYAELRRRRDESARRNTKPLKTPAECLATWETA
jgi:hypothetical protein